MSGEYGGGEGLRCENCEEEGLRGDRALNDIDGSRLGLVDGPADGDSAVDL